MTQYKTIERPSTATIGYPPLTNLSQLLTEHAQTQPERIAIGISDLSHVVNYQKLELLVNSAKTQLSLLGLNRSHTVALLADNCIEFVVALLAVTSFGARLAPLNPSLTVIDVQARLNALSAHALLIPKHLENQVDHSAFLSGTSALWTVNVEVSSSSAAVHIHDIANKTPAAEAGTSSSLIAGDDVALVMFTAGSTGAPKAVPWTHRNILESIRNIASWYDLSPADATLIVMPMFHGHGLVAGLLATLVSGGSVYLPTTGGFSAHLFWPDMVRVRATWFTAVPTIHRILVNRASQDYPGLSAPALRFIRSCSAPIDEDLATAMDKTFGAPVISAYGMTEATHQVSSNPLPMHGTNRISSVGLPTGVEMRIVAEDGNDLPVGGIGEVWVRGATVISGYLENPEANASSFSDGWFRSGDLGSMDTPGYLDLKGRIKEQINRGGEKIAPGDIDVALLSNPAVLEAVAFPEPHPIYGECVHAAVVLRSGSNASEQELEDYCRSKLSSFEVPERIHIVSSIPNTAKGAVDRRALSTQFR
ncbi:AMP-binding protein [Granulicella sp. L60]|uniref:AMP-binding protein n=1 Tax=Granulicella sp. L60 TaxID=1641866 RepID=UPI00131B91AB|nr:AMP-binding protein [Granulicella sp. L60]